MAKYQKLTEPVFVTSCESRGSRYGGDIWELHLKGIRTQCDYKTYADPQNANWRTWQHIVQSAQHKGVVLSNCKIKDTDKAIINADSDIRIEYCVTREELADALADYWDKLAQEQSSYRRFFSE